jgi:hypothetical protein
MHDFRSIPDDLQPVFLVDSKGQPGDFQEWGNSDLFVASVRELSLRPGILSGCGIMEGVGIWSKAFYFTAMSLLLFMAAQVVACDILHSDNCYISSHSPNPDRNSGDASGENCLCCCQHVAVTQPLVFEPRETIVAALSEEMIQQPLVAPSRIYHPPRLS